MIEKVWDSIKGHIAHKTSDPFFGIFIVIWLIKNWNLAYSLLNFDEGTTLEQKRNFVIQHFQATPFFETLLICLAEAFIILIITYWVINLSRLIINFYEKQVTPLTYKITDKNSVVLRSDYDKLVENILILESRIEEEKSLKYKYKEEVETLERRNWELLLSKNIINVEEPEDVEKEENNEESFVKNIFNNLSQKNQLAIFEKIVSRILNGEDTIKDSFVEEYAMIGLIAYKGFRTYSLTPLGQKLHSYIIREKLK